MSLRFRRQIYPDVAGWRRDPDGRRVLRYFNGTKFTNRYRRIPGWSKSWCPEDATSQLEIRSSPFVLRSIAKVIPGTSLSSPRRNFTLVSALVVLVLCGGIGSVVVVNRQLNKAPKIYDQTFLETARGVCIIHIGESNRLRAQQFDDVDDAQRADIFEHASNEILTAVNAINALTIADTDVAVRTEWTDHLRSYGLAGIELATALRAGERNDDAQTRANADANYLTTFGFQNKVSACRPQ